MSDDPRRVIARAIARSGLFYKRSALLSGVIALAVCTLVVVVEDTAQKGVLLGLAMVLAIFTYRSIRLSQRCFDVDASPVLAVIARAPSELARVRCARPKPGGPWLVTVEDRAAHRLELRLPPELGEAEIRQLASAFAAISPEAAVEGADVRTPAAEPPPSGDKSGDKSGDASAD